MLEILHPYPKHTTDLCSTLYQIQNSYQHQHPLDLWPTLALPSHTQISPLPPIRSSLPAIRCFHHVLDSSRESLLLLSHFSRVRLCVTPQTAAHQTPPSLGFSRQEHWSGLPFPSPMHESKKWKWSHSVMSNPQRPHGLQPTRLLCPWDFPGKSTGVGCHCLLRRWISGVYK